MRCGCCHPRTASGALPRGLFSSSPESLPCARRCPRSAGKHTRGSTVPDFGGLGRTAEGTHLCRLTICRTAMSVGGADKCWERSAGARAEGLGARSAGESAQLGGEPCPDRKEAAKPVLTLQC